MIRLFVFIGLLSICAGCGRERATEHDPVLDSESTDADASVAASQDTVPVDSDSAEPQTEPDASQPVVAPLPVTDPDPEHTESIASTDLEEDSANDSAIKMDAAELNIDDTDATEPSNSMVMEQPEEESRQPPHYLIWLPTTKGPVLLGLDIWVGETTLQAAFDQAFEQVMTDAHNEFAESLTWEDFIDHVSDNPAKFGSNSMRSNGQKRNLIKNYDRNENDKVELDEAKRFVLRDSLFSSELRFYGTDAFRYLNRSKSRLFAAMDRNDDRELDATEIAVAPEALIAALDANSDGCIDFAEAEPENEMDASAWNRRRSRRHGDVAMDLAGFVNWNNVSYSMSGQFQSSPFPADGAPIQDLDENQSESIDPDEARRLLEFDPSIRLIVRYPESGAPARVDSEIVDVDNSIKMSQSANGDRLDLSTDIICLSVALRDSARVNTQIPREAFDQLDANQDGGLDEDEIPDGAEDQLNIASLDQNDDGKLSYDELTQRRVDVESIWASQVRGRAAEYPAAIFAWLDRDHDHFLSAREVQGTKHALTKLLKDRQAITPDDFPEAYLVQIGRGEPQQDDALFTPQRERRPGSDARPTWAIRMDANGDGEIAAIEFPGSIKQFHELDQDKDGYLSATEVSSL